MTDYAYVAYLDILGYKEFLDSDVRAGTQTFKDRMTKAFRTFEGINTSRHHYKAISDSIFITCTERSAAKEFLVVVRDVYISFLAQGLMIRGGVSFGQHFENQSITYSPVLTKAYLLESEVAEFPRVMIDSNLDDMFPDLKRDGLILRTGDHWFLNIATNENFKNVWDAAEGTFRSSTHAIQKSERVRIKHRWLQDFLIEVSRKLGIASPQPYLGIFDDEVAPLEIIPETLLTLPVNQVLNENMLVGQTGGTVVSTKQTVEGNATSECNRGQIRMTLLRDTQIATGSGKFIPEMSRIPNLTVQLLEMPDGCLAEHMKYTAKTGTNFDFNINVRAASYREPLPSGVYVFSYEAKTTGNIFGQQNPEN